MATPEELKAAMDAAHASGDIKEFVRLKREYEASSGTAKADKPAMRATTAQGKTGEIFTEPAEGPGPAEQFAYAAMGATKGTLQAPRAVGLDPIAPEFVEKLGEEQDALREGELVGSVVGRPRTWIESLEEAPSIALSALPMSRTASGLASLGRIAQQTGLGAASGAMAPAESAEEQRMAAGLGAAFGLVGQGLPEAFVGGQNLATRKFRVANDLSRTAEGRMLEKVVGTKMTLGQLSADPEILRLEAEAAGKAKEAFYKKQFPSVQRYFTRVADKLDPKMTPDGELIKQVEGAFDQYLGVLRTYRRAGWVEDMARVNEAAGGQFKMNPSNLMSNLQSIAEASSKIGSKITPSESAAARVELEKIMEKGYIDVADLDNLLQQYTAEGARTGNMFKDMEPNMAKKIANDLRSALEKDIDALGAVATDGPNSPGAKVANALRTARDNYRKASEPINELKGTVLEKWFGKEGHLVPETVLDKFSKLPPSELQNASNVINAIDPSIMDRARAHFIRGAINKTYQASRKVSDPAYKLTSMANYLEQNPDYFRAAFPNVDQRREVYRGIQTLRHMAERGTDVPAMNMKEVIGGSAINLMNRDPGFIARYVTKVFTPGQLENLLFTEQGMKVLTTLQTPKPTWAQKAQAAAALQRMMVED